MLGQLPTEVLEPIFRACDQETYETSRLQLKLLALVCRRFRDILIPLRYETIFCGEPSDDPLHRWETNPFSQTLKKHPWRAALVKDVHINFIKSSINFLAEFQNLVKLEMTHDYADEALRHLPMQETLFPKLRDFKLSFWDDECHIGLSDIMSIWVQRKLETFTLDRICLCLKHVDVTFNAHLPPLRSMIFCECDLEDREISPLLSVRSIKQLTILECKGSFPLLIASAKHCLQSLTLVDGQWTDESLFGCLDDMVLKQLHIDVRHFLVCEYGEFNMNWFGRRLREHLGRRENGLELLHLEQLTIVFDGVRETKVDFYNDSEAMVWTPSTFRHIMASVQTLAPKIQKVVYKFYVPMYDALYEDFHYQIADLKTIGEADGLKVELEFYENDLTLEPIQKKVENMVTHDDKHLRSLLNIPGDEKGKLEDKLGKDSNEV